MSKRTSSDSDPNSKTTFSRADFIILASTLLYMLMIFSSALYIQKTDRMPQVQNVMSDAIY